MRVLVVEDDARTANMLRRGLTEDGHVVDVTADGQEALWRAGEVDYEAIVLDVMLPGTDGYQLCRRLRAAGCWSAVLMLTARGALDDRVRGLDAGADDYLAKPFEFAELCARLRAIARRGTRARPSVLGAGDLMLDPAARRAWRGATEVELSAKEFALLELFLRRPDEVLSRSAIRDHLWDFASEVTSNVVDQFVASLRRKIDRPFRVSQLETVRGVGYRLRPLPVPAAAETADAFVDDEPPA
jgi:two-component system OmpR family response regulator